MPGVQVASCQPTTEIVGACASDDTQHADARAKSLEDGAMAKFEGKMFRWNFWKFQPGTAWKFRPKFLRASRDFYSRDFYSRNGFRCGRE